METLTQEEYQKRLTDLASARKWKQQESAKTVKIIKRNWLQIGLDFLTK